MSSKKERVKKAQTNFAASTEEVETLGHFMIRKLDDVFVKNIPLQSIRDLPVRYMYIFGALAHLLLISTFIYFTYNGYHSALKTTFVSTENGKFTF